MILAKSYTDLSLKLYFEVFCYFTSYLYIVENIAAIITSIQ